MSFQRDLGRREREMLNAIWMLGAGTVHEIARHLSTKLSGNSVATQLNRLVKKGLLRRQKRGRAFIYSADLNARELEENRAAELVRRLFSESNQHPDILLDQLDTVDADTNLASESRDRLRDMIENHGLATARR